MCQFPLKEKGLEHERSDPTWARVCVCCYTTQILESSWYMSHLNPNSHRGSARAMTLESSLVLHNLLIYFHIRLHLDIIYSPGHHRARILSSSHSLHWWSHCFHPHCWHKSENRNRPLWWYKRVCLVVGNVMMSINIKGLNVLTCPSFRVICPCSLQPIKVRLHLNTLSPTFTCCAYDTGKKPILSSITP